MGEISIFFNFIKRICGVRLFILFYFIKSVLLIFIIIYKDDFFLFSVNFLGYFLQYNYLFIF